MAQVSIERWRSHVEAAAKAGVTLAQYAREHGLSRHTLYAARQAMKTRDEKESGKRGTRRTKAFVPVRVSAPATAPIAFSVRLANGLELRFGAVEAEALQSLVPLLAGLPCSV